MSNARKVSTDALETLGTIIGENEKRDAIHIAVLPVIAGEKLHAGQDIGLVDDQATTGAREKLGIVDPFLKIPVQKGERFWMLLYPRMVTSLRHVWSHPAFVDEPGTSAPSAGVASAMTKAKQYIQGVADAAGLGYDEIVEAARSYVKHGDYLCEGGRWEGFYINDEFWTHFELATGDVVPENERGSFFSCSC